MLIRKLKLNKITILLTIIIGLIFIQALLMAPQDVSNSEKASITKTQIEKLAQQQNSKKAVEQKMTGVHLVENSNNAKGWELYADEATGSSDELWVLKKVRVEFFSENESSFVVSGELGEIDGRSKNMIIRGQVTTQSANGYQFVTNDLVYVAEKKQLQTEDQVNMLGPQDKNGAGFKLNGQGFVIDLAKNKMYIQSNIQASKDIDGKKFNVTSQSADFSNKSREAQFLGDVKMNFDKTSLRSPQAIFKYSDKQKALETILLKDKVFLRDEAKTASCQQLIMNVLEDTMTLQGQPKVQMGEDEIQGEEITFLEGGKKVRMSKVKIQSKDLKY